ncbi:hypothetical protein VHUM_03819 [Vanrija humicola]|uniref:DNA-directed RNA polymerase I subunit RPA34 n=1 Tax=Vanrija humicola TaxID=5417 RepID=A0A7D8YW70_VANHU|nr:hypothetical protein VHUM_03819 [Vanrija humicola]
MEPINVSVSYGTSPFEYDALSRRAGVELWAIRVPSDFKTSRLSSLALETPGTSVRGELTTHGKTYALGTDTDSAGAEMAGLTLLVPRMSAGGKLQRAPLKLSRRLILTPRAGADKTDEAEQYVAPPKVKRVQPEHLLKFRNRVSGFDTPGPSGAAETSEGAPAAPASETAASPKKSKESKDKDGKRKKRKSGADEASPSKKKKKTADE